MPANRLRELREEAGLSALQLGQRIGVAESTIVRWETQVIKTIPDPTKQELAEFFSVTVAFLMGWDNGGDNGERTAAA